MSYAPAEPRTVNTAPLRFRLNRRLTIIRSPYMMPVYLRVAPITPPIQSRRLPPFHAADEARLV